MAKGKGKGNRAIVECTAMFQALLHVAGHEAIIDKYGWNAVDNSIFYDSAGTASNLQKTIVGEIRALLDLPVEVVPEKIGLDSQLDHGRILYLIEVAGSKFVKLGTLLIGDKRPTIGHRYKNRPTPPALPKAFEGEWNYARLSLLKFVHTADALGIKPDKALHDKINSKARRLQMPVDATEFHDRAFVFDIMKLMEPMPEVAFKTVAVQTVNVASKKVLKKNLKASSSLHAYKK